MTNLILKKQLAAKQNKKKGFTLIELIVVIVIIAIIAAIAVPSLTRYIGSAEKRALQATAHNIQLVLQAEQTEVFNVPFRQGPTNDYSLAAYAMNGTTAVPWDATTTTSTVSFQKILNDNSIFLKNGETLTNITYSGTTLTAFTLANAKYTMSFSNTGGFTNPVEIPAT